MPGELNPTEVGYPIRSGMPHFSLILPEVGIIPGQRRLLADAELADHGLVSLGVVFLQIVQQAATLADQHEKSAARAVVFLVRLEVLRQLANPLAQQSDLNFRATGIARMRAVLVNEGFFLLSG